MAKITTITNPLTGQPAQVDQLDHTAQQIDDAIARALPGGAIDSVLSSKPNPNLLDNWYFGNPVNQRGDTQHTGASVTYFIDRWRCGGYNQTIELTQQGLRWSSNTGIWLLQPIENYDDLVGKVVTVSALIDNVLYSATGTVSKTGSIVTRTPSDVYLEVTHAEKGVRFVTYSTNTSQISILAVKLELGTQQTLAHQENGNWVLNEIPDYGEQLARCQRYQWITNADNNMPTPLMYAATTNTLVGSVQFPVTMRTKPAVTGVFVRNVLTGETLSAVNNDSNNVVTNQDGVCYIAGMFSTLTVGGWYQVAAIFDANL